MGLRSSLLGVPAAAVSAGTCALTLLLWPTVAPAPTGPDVVGCHGARCTSEEPVRMGCVAGSGDATGRMAAM
ncbi:hypothetical protein ACTWQF_04180 [Streptomyces sp. 8N114]|uniref:hypothetical protein n=1 Tax=Streptomyces sp. 8N114 TaxID=3457419 RepID=UPI003FD29D2D